MTRPNFVLITADDMNWDTVGHLGVRPREQRPISTAWPPRDCAFSTAMYGMAFPFAKTNCYLNSTRTPWVVRWPAVVEAGRVDAKHFISGIDYLPTVLDAMGVDLPDGVNGQSLLPVLRGEEQAGCEQVFTQFHQTSARSNYPMRCVRNARLASVRTNR